MLSALQVPVPRVGASTWVFGLLGIVAVTVIDFATGVDIRVFPLYYVPLAALAWRGGRAGALIATLLCGAGWLGSNALAGLEYSLTRTWAINTVTQTASFATVGILIALVRDSLIRERGLSRTDALTAMLNRKGLYEEATRLMALCRRAGRPMTVAYIDLDNFKAVNDRLGHQGGDATLRSAAELLRRAIRPSDVAARVGGDEFMVLFPELGAAEAGTALERIRSAFSGALGSGVPSVSASVGGVTFTAVPEGIEEMVNRADELMYRAKSAGRDRVELTVV